MDLRTNSSYFAIQCYLFRFNKPNELSLLSCKITSINKIVYFPLHMDKFRSNIKGKAMQALSCREVRNALNGSQQCNDSFTR